MWGSVDLHHTALCTEPMLDFPSSTILQRATNLRAMWFTSVERSGWPGMAELADNELDPPQLNGYGSYSV